MNKMIITAFVLASVAVTTTTAFAHRSTPPSAPHQMAKPDIAKTLFDQLERNGR